MLVSSGSWAVMWFGATYGVSHGLQLYMFRAPAVCGRAVVSSLKKCLCYMPFSPSPPSPSGRCGKYIVCGLVSIFTD